MIQTEIRVQFIFFKAILVTVSDFGGRFLVRGTDMDLIRQDVLHRHNTRNKGNFRLPRVKRNWGKQRTQYHAVSDFNSLSQTIKDSRNVNSFKRNVFKFLI